MEQLVMFDEQGRLIVAFCQDCGQSYKKATLTEKLHECDASKSAGSD